MTAAVVVALALALLWGLDCRRQRDGAREVARQAKQGWDAAAARADLWERACRASMARESKLMEHKDRIAPR